MKAPTREGGGDFEKHPPGATTLVCTRIIDKGTVWNEQKQKNQRKISICFESSKLMTTGDFAGEPFLIFQSFGNYSMYKNSHLCQFVEAWLGKPFATQEEADAFDLSTLLGKPMFANIVHNGQYVNITSPMPVPDGMTAPTPVGKMYVLDMNNIDVAVIEQLSDKMRENIMRSLEWEQYQNRKNGGQPQQPVQQESAGMQPTPPVEAYAEEELNDPIPF